MMRLNPEREQSMNVVNYPLVGFKEFEAYQPQYFEPSSQSSPWAQTAGSSLPDIVKSIAGTGTQSEFARNPWSSSFHSGNSRMVPSGFLSDRSQSHRYRFHPAQSQRNDVTSNNMSLDMRSTQKSSQSTELTIQTRDGDTVTIQIRERSIEQEQSQVQVSANGGSNVVQSRGDPAVGFSFS